MSLTADPHEIAGDFRRPHNTASQAKGSIHDDATASKLGFRGGTVAGSLHMDQYVPLLLQAFGAPFLQRGNVSLYFRQATVDQEAVRAFVVPAAGAPRARLRMENEAGDLISEGTASCLGADEKTELYGRARAQTPAAPGSLRLLAACKAGDETRDVPLRVSAEAVTRRLTTIPETIPAYSEAPPVLPPSLVTQLFRDVEKHLWERIEPVVGLFGAIELQFLGGPLRADTDYVGRARILALSESPKTENIWYQAWAADPKTGEDVGWMIMYLRFLKASSPLWTEG
ncbi:hypothetical protein ACO2Q3_02220 [Caulobacter sp. KR2-114]|uniref:hypothetical protein n=1 Tax=Caulobacter sp. KR2-114 TaxID=3400912 RepID=UPI003C076EF9